MKESLYLAFDLETVGLPWEYFDESQQEYLLRGAATEEDRDKKIRELALSPLCAKIVCIGISVIRGTGEEQWHTEKEGALVLDETMADGEQRRETLDSGLNLVYSNEVGLLNGFWKMLLHYPSIHLVSFNGRGFDAPFLMLRSAVHHIRPVRNLMGGTKWNYPHHTDLADELSYFGYQTSGPLRRFNFDFYARCFGIPSPKGQGVDGSKVGEFYEAGRLPEIAEYCMRDVRATWELYLFWKKYLAFEKYGN